MLETLEQRIDLTYRASACMRIIGGLLLVVFASSQAEAASFLQDQAIGFATVAGKTIGGGSATPVTVKTFAELKSAAQDAAPRVIIVTGLIKTESGSGMSIGSNKTIRGADKNATIHGGLSINSVSNVVLRNFNLKGIWPHSGPDDSIAVRNSHHVWIDHLNIWDSGDGSLDITKESSYITVSWCKFWYTDKQADGNAVPSFFFKSSLRNHTPSSMS